MKNGLGQVLIVFSAWTVWVSKGLASGLFFGFLLALKLRIHGAGIAKKPGQKTWHTP